MAPIAFLVEVTGFEPAASCSQSRRATNCATPRLQRYIIRYRHPYCQESKCRQAKRPVYAGPTNLLYQTVSPMSTKRLVFLCFALLRLVHFVYFYNWKFNKTVIYYNQRKKGETNVQVKPISKNPMRNHRSRTKATPRKNNSNIKATRLRVDVTRENDWEWILYRGPRV